MKERCDGLLRGPIRGEIMSQTKSPQTPVIADERPWSDDTHPSLALRVSIPARSASEGRPALLLGDSPKSDKPVDRAYLEFSARRDAGEEIDPDDFCAQHPSMKNSLGRLIHAHVFLEQNSSLVRVILETPWPEAGKMFLDYRLLHLLGQGAFARVFL